MKFFSALSTLVLATMSLAQNVAIGAPSDGSSVAAGSNFTVEIDRPNTLSASTEVAVVIALQSCPTDACIAPSDFLGPVLYSGPYSPQLPSASSEKPPFQNFTVAVPPSMAKGRAQLSVTHMSLIGAGPQPFVEFKNLTLNIV